MIPVRIYGRYQDLGVVESRRRWNVLEGQRPHAPADVALADRHLPRHDATSPGCTHVNVSGDTRAPQRVRRQGRPKWGVRCSASARLPRLTLPAAGEVPLYQGE